MKVFLLHRDRDFAVKPGLRDAVFGAMVSGNLHAIANVKRERGRQLMSSAPGPLHGSDAGLAQDLELRILWSAMAAGDEFLFEMAKRAVLSSLSDPEAIVYRQHVLADCLEQPATVREMYALAIEAIGSEREVGSLWSGVKPGWILSRSVRLLRLYVDVLKRLRQIADERSESFQSDGFTRFFAMLQDELADDYLETVQRRLRELEFSGGVLESAELAKGDKGDRYIVHTPPSSRERRWRERLGLRHRTPDHSFELDPRDEAGLRALEELRGKGINHVANAVAQSADHVKSFFIMLRLELAFYLGCLNLRERLDHKGEPYCFPEPLGQDSPAVAAGGSTTSAWRSTSSTEYSATR